MRKNEKEPGLAEFRMGWGIFVKSEKGGFL